MAELRKSLEYLAPISWEDVPQDNLASFCSQCFTAAELLVNSVPPPPSGTPFDTAQPHNTTPNAARSSKDVHSSTARPSPPDQSHADLQKNWGKPVKFSQKENPLNVALYKMAGDRRGAWFARHNIMEGIGFAKFKKALMREFPETLLEQGAPGAGAKRGLSAERRVERIEVDGVGRAEVYHLSAQMPPPVTPRDFSTLFMTTSTGLTEKSGAAIEDGNKHVPRSYMIVSRPVEHPDAPQRSSFVRGQYESVELIREIPLHKSKSTADLLSTNGEASDPELNPVEWIMITRSDPAGGVPRFLVDRGTPGAMLSDVTKFLDWACGQEEIPDPDADVDKQLEQSEQKTKEITQEESGAATNQEGVAAQEAEKTAREAVAPVAVAKSQEETGGANDQTQDAQAAESGIVSTLTNSLEAGLNSYAPAPVANFVQKQIHPDLDDDSSSDSSSVDSFLSAEEMRRMSSAPDQQPQKSTENVSLVSATTSSSDLSKAEKKNLSPHDREILKITQQREKLDTKLAKKRQTEEDKLKQSQEKEQSEQGKAKERMEKEMKKTEERHRKDIEKLEAKRAKELKKAEERRRKKDDQNKLSLVARERDDYRNQADLLRKENELFRGQVEALQKENGALAARLEKVVGTDVVKGLREEAGGRSRTVTVESGSSGGGGEKRES